MPKKSAKRSSAKSKSGKGKREKDSQPKTGKRGAAAKAATKKTSDRKKGKSKSGPTLGGKQRLQRLLASAGFGSRRQCEDLIEAGRIDVDGEIVTKLGTTVDPAINKVSVDGDPLKKQKLVYFAVNKPTGVVTTNRDPHGRPRVIDFVPPTDRVFPVGRLDRSSEGLILLTNDGELAQKLTHPKFGVKKVYRGTVAGRVTGETMRKMREGIYIAEGHVKVDGARLLKAKGKATEMEIILREGKNREIRRILARLGHKVQHLRRIAVGPLRLGDTPPGAYRIVTREEVAKLWASTEESAQDPEVQSRAKKKRGVKRHGAKKGTKKWGPKKTASARGGTKKSTKRKSPKATVIGGEFSIERQRSGVVIGGDPIVEKEKKKRGTKKSRSSTSRGSKKATGRKKSSSRGSTGRKRKR